LPISIPQLIGATNAELGHGMGFGPPGAGDFEAGLEEVPVGAFDQAGTDGQTGAQGRGVIKLVEPVFEIAQRAACRGLLVGGCGWRAGR